MNANVLQFSKNLPADLRTILFGSLNSQRLRDLADCIESHDALSGDCDCVSCVADRYLIEITWAALIPHYRSELLAPPANADDVCPDVVRTSVLAAAASRFKQTVMPAAEEAMRQIHEPRVFWKSRTLTHSSSHPSEPNNIP